MSDIVESLIGAIYIDTQGSLAACEAFLRHLGLMTYLQRVIDGDVALLHPKEELGQLANQSRVDYQLGKEVKDGEKRLRCNVVIGNRNVVGVGDGLSVLEVQTRAADEACKVLKGEGANSCGAAAEEIRSAEELGSESEHKIRQDCESDEDVYILRMNDGCKGPISHGNTLPFITDFALAMLPAKI